MPWLEPRRFASCDWLRDPSWRLALLENALDTVSDAVTVSICIADASGEIVKHKLFQNRAAVEAHQRSESAGDSSEAGTSGGDSEPSSISSEQLKIAEITLAAPSLRRCDASDELTAVADADAVQLKICSSASVSPLYNPCLRAVLNASPLGVFVCKPDGALEWTSSFLEADTGVSVERMAGSGWHAVIHADDLPKAHSAWGAALSTGEYPPYEERVSCGPADDPWRWYACSCKAMRDPSTGRILRWIGMLANIHERKQLEEKLAAERTLFATAIEQLPMSVFVADAPSGAIRIANRQTYEVWRMDKAASSLEDYGRFVGYHADGRPYAPGDWPIARSLLHGEVVTKEDTPYQRG